MKHVSFGRPKSGHSIKQTKCPHYRPGRPVVFHFTQQCKVFEILIIGLYSTPKICEWPAIIRVLGTVENILQSGSQYWCIYPLESMIGNLRIWASDFPLWKGAN